LTLSLTAPETPVWVKADSIRLNQVLANLLDNAFQFTNRGERVEVHLTVEEHQAQVAVRDTGVGIDAQMLPLIFDAFIQADRTLERSRGGLGLGLTVVKGLVELHGGNVEAASDGPGRGSVFTFRLPVEPEPQALTGSSASPERARQGLRVLVIEDNHDTADSLCLFLTLLGHQARAAYTGPEGVYLAREWRPDLVLSDIGLPGLNGHGVARALRLDPITSGARLIALTGYGMEEDRRRSREAGFDHHLVKPVDPDELRGLLAENRSR
jgi:CheY-like chemotaxis protein